MCVFVEKILKKKSILLKKKIGNNSNGGTQYAMVMEKLGKKYY